MSSCTSCGHQLGVGRFCTNCGAPVDSSVPDATPVSTPVTDPVNGGDWRTDTAERRLSGPPSDPRTPPAAVAPPPPPRYPLYADEVAEYAPYGPKETTPEGPLSAPAPTVGADHYEDHEQVVQTEPAPWDYYEERRSPVLWILVAALVLVMVGAGWWVFVRDDGSGADGASDSGNGGSSQGAQASGEDGVDVAGRASAKAPRTAAPNQDVNGDQVSYDASNMLDGVPTTAWRAAGDGTGMKLTFTLHDSTELHQVGLINGYAKTSTDDKNRTFDWYHGNRRINEVMWVFDDGSKVRQQLDDDTDLQMVDVDVVTDSVVLRLLEVSGPGEGSAGRNFTAISEVSFIGTTPG